MYATEKQLENLILQTRMILKKLPDTEQNMIHRFCITKLCMKIEDATDPSKTCCSVCQQEVETLFAAFDSGDQEYCSDCQQEAEADSMG